MTLEAELLEMGRRARLAAAQLRSASAEQRSAGIRAMARALRAGQGNILAANAEDMKVATVHHDRLRLDEERLEAIAVALEQIAGLPDPVGVEMERWQRPNGLDIARVRSQR